MYDKEWKMFEDTDIRIPEKTILLVELTKYHTLIDEVCFRKRFIFLIFLEEYERV